MTDTPTASRWRQALPLTAAVASFVLVAIAAAAAARSLLAPVAPPPTPPHAPEARPAPVAKVDETATISLKAAIADLETRLAQRDTDAAKMEALADARGKDYDRVHAENEKLSAENARLAASLKQSEQSARDAKAASEREVSAAKLKQAAAERAATDAASEKRRTLEAELASVDASLGDAVRRRDSVQSSYDALHKLYDAEMEKARTAYDKEMGMAEDARKQARRLGYAPTYADGFYTRTKSSADRNDALRRADIDSRWQPVLSAVKGPLDPLNAFISELQSRREKLLSSLGRNN